MVKRHDQSSCEICVHAAEHGWWGTALPSGATHCSGCGRSWSGKSEAHCTGCHRHFSTDRNAERHLGRAGRCLSDRSITRRGLRLVDSKWGRIWKGAAMPADVQRRT